MEPIGLGVLITAAIAGTAGEVIDSQLRSGLQIVRRQVIAGTPSFDDEMLHGARRAQMLALLMSVRGYEQLAQAKRHTSQPLTAFIRRALRDEAFEPLDRNSLRSLIKQVEALLVDPPAPNGVAQPRQLALRRISEEWTLAEARANVRNHKDWSAFEQLVRNGHTAMPAWWEIYCAFLAEEIRRDVRLAAMIVRPAIVEVFGKRRELGAVLADMRKGQEHWMPLVEPTLPAFSTASHRVGPNLKLFIKAVDTIGPVVSSNTPAAKERRQDQAEATRALEDHIERLVQTAAERDDEASSLVRAGRLKDALVPSKAALALYRELAALDRDAFVSELAESLSTFANRLARAQRNDEAIAATTEAVAIYRDLATQDRSAALPELGGGLNTLSLRLSQASRHQDALVCSDEAVAVRRELVAADDDAHAEGLARACGVRAHVLRTLERYTDAIDAFKQGIETLNPLMPDEALSPLYVSLVSEMAATLDAIGRGREAAALRAQLA